MINKVGFWCQKVLPLVYDDSLSYYEVLCKVRDKMNEIIMTSNQQTADINAVKQAVAIINQWIADFDTTFIQKEIENYIATMILVSINEGGYIVYNIPETWEDITFNTTQLDILVGSDYEYGRLVLSY